MILRKSITSQLIGVLCSNKMQTGYYSMNFIPFPTLFIIFSVAFWNFFDIHEKVKKTECGRILLDHTVQTRSVFRN